VGGAFEGAADVNNSWSDSVLAEAFDAIDDIAESDWHVVRSVDGLTDNGLKNAYPPVSYIIGFGKPARVKKIVLALLKDDRMRMVWQSIDRSLESAHSALLEDVERLSEAKSKRPFFFDPEKIGKDESKVSCLIARECVREMTRSSLANSKAKYTADLNAISDALHKIGEQLQHDTHFNHFAGRTAGKPLKELVDLSLLARLAAKNPPDFIRRGGQAQTRKLNLIDGLGQVFLKVFNKPMDSEVADIVSVVTDTDVSAAEVKTERTRYQGDPTPFVYR
jgi:hypothetical protein